MNYEDILYIRDNALADKRSKKRLPSTVNELIELCQPGKYFIGLWIVKVRRKGKYYMRWCVSYIDKNNVHAETDLYADPIKALKQCARELKILK